MLKISIVKWVPYIYGGIFMADTARVYREILNGMHAEKGRHMEAEEKIKNLEKQIALYKQKEQLYKNHIIFLETEIINLKNFINTWKIHSFPFFF